MFEHIPPYPGDPILSLFQAFQGDASPRKVNLSIGLYHDETGAIPILSSVQKAAAQLLQQPAPHGYLPMEGLAPYRLGLQQLVFGPDCPALREGRIATLQSVGGSGALRIGAEFLKRYFPDSGIWLSDPTWDNHRTLFTAAGLDVHTYPYYDAQHNRIRFDAMLDTLQTLPARSVVLLQPSCHNPTGMDLSRPQWQQLIELATQRGLIPFMDMAYQGFGDGLDHDAWPIRAMVDAGLPVIVSNSFSKNFSLYGERCGGLSIVCASKAEADAVLSQMQAAVRKNYSSPPLHGARLVATVLNNPALMREWEQEIAAMRDRIRRMRGALRQRLEDALPGTSFEYLTTQRGMFSFTGLSPAAVDQLRTERGVYLLRSGRACMAGLNDTNLDYVADAMCDVLAPATAA